MKLVPRSEVIPRVEYPDLPFVFLKRSVCSHLGVNEGVNIPSRGQSSPLGANSTPGGKQYSWRQTVLLEANSTPGGKFMLLKLASELGDLPSFHSVKRFIWTTDPSEF
jgi:hypothetical protein